MTDKKDLWAGVFLLVLGIFIIVYLIPFHIEDESASSLSPRFFPYFSATLLALMSALLTFQNYLKIRTLSTKKTEEEQKEKPMSRSDVLRPWLGVVILGIYFYLFEMIGFLYATPIAMIALMWLFGQRKKTTLVFTSFIITAALYLIFEKGLKVPLG